MQVDPYCQREKYSEGILVSGGMCGYSQAFRGEGASNDSAVIEIGDFHCFRSLYVGNLERQTKNYYIVFH